jgi:hypothetical protein
MITSEALADFILSWYGAASMAAFFAGWRARKRLWKGRKRVFSVRFKWIRRSVGVTALAYWTLSQDHTHLVVMRLGLILFFLAYWWVWKRRFIKAKGKHRHVYHLPEGENYADRERMARYARERALNQYQNDALDRQEAAPDRLEAKAGDKRLVG